MFYAVVKCFSVVVKYFSVVGGGIFQIYDGMF